MTRIDRRDADRARPARARRARRRQCPVDRSRRRCAARALDDEPTFAESLVPLDPLRVERSARAARRPVEVHPGAAARAVRSRSAIPASGRISSTASRHARARFRSGIEQRLQQEQAALRERRAGRPPRCRPICSRSSARSATSARRRRRRRARRAPIRRTRSRSTKTLNTLMREGLVDLREGRFAASLARFQQLFDRGIDSFEAHYYAARALAGLKRWREAAVALRRGARRSCPAYTAAYSASPTRIWPTASRPGARRGAARAEGAARRSATHRTRRRHRAPASAIARWRARAYERVAQMAPARRARAGQAGRAVPRPGTAGRRGAAAARRRPARSGDRVVLEFARDGARRQRRSCRAPSRPFARPATRDARQRAVRLQPRPGAGAAEQARRGGRRSFGARSSSTRGSRRPATARRAAVGGRRSGIVLLRCRDGAARRLVATYSAPAAVVPTFLNWDESEPVHSVGTTGRSDVPGVAEVGVHHHLHGALPATELAGRGRRSRRGFGARRRRRFTRPTSWRTSSACCSCSASPRVVVATRGARRRPIERDSRCAARCGAALWPAPAPGGGRRLDQRAAVHARAGLSPGLTLLAWLRTDWPRVDARGGSRRSCCMPPRSPRGPWPSVFPLVLVVLDALAVKRSAARERSPRVAVRGCWPRSRPTVESVARAPGIERCAVALPSAIGACGAVRLPVAHRRARVADAARSCCRPTRRRTRR